MKSRKTNARERRHQRIRKKIHGTKARPRLVIYRSNNNVYAQLVDDNEGITLASASDMKLNKNSKTESAKQVGENLAKNAASAKIKECVFDRSGYKYHGRIKAVAEAAREAGLKF